MASSYIVFFSWSPIEYSHMIKPRDRRDTGNREVQRAVVSTMDTRVRLQLVSVMMKWQNGWNEGARETMNEGALPQNLPWIDEEWK